MRLNRGSAVDEPGSRYRHRPSLGQHQGVYRGKRRARHDGHALEHVQG
jgi:hypothetical protein